MKTFNASSNKQITKDVGKHNYEETCTLGYIHDFFTKCCLMYLIYKIINIKGKYRVLILHNAKGNDLK